MSSVDALMEYLSEHPEVMIIGGFVVLTLAFVVWYIYRPVTWREGDGPVVRDRNDQSPWIGILTILDWIFRR